MARKAADSTQRGVPAGGAGWSNGNPPPSTIAAQIVNNHSRVNEQQEPQNDALFGQLLQEFLTDPSAEEPDVRLNLQLVSVVVEAGFDALLKNPFHQDALLPQAKDSISVIKISVERNPDLLFYHDVEGAYSGTKPPLLAWLLPKLLSLLSRPSLQPIHADITGLLSSFTHVLAISRESWQKAAVLTEIYQACIDSILSEVEYASKNTSSFPPPFKVTLPPSNSIRQLLPESQQLVVLPQNCQTEISDPDQATVIALALLCAMCGYFPTTQNTCVAGISLITICDWAADRYTRLWQHASRLKVGKKGSQEQSQVSLTPFLQVSKRLVEMTMDTGHSETFSTRTLTLVFDNIADLLQHFCQTRPSGFAQIELSSILLRTFWLSRQAIARNLIGSYRAIPLGSLCEEYLVPVLRDIALDEAKVGVLDKDLRLSIFVCAADATFGDNTEEVQVMARLRAVQDRQTFEDTQLAEGFSELLLAEPQNEFLDDIRPRKRQRLDEPNRPAATGPYYDKLMATAMGYVPSTSNPDSNMIQEYITNTFAKLSEQEKSKATQAFMHLPCAAVGTLDASVLSNGELSDMTCRFCDGDSRENDSDSDYWDHERYGKSWEVAVVAMSKILEIITEQRLKETRILATMAIRNLASHLRDRRILDLKVSPLGEWCMKSLRSSLRERRIAAGRALPMFLRKDIPEDVRQDNRRYALEFMKELSEKDDLGEQETLILAFGQIARTCDDFELNLSLLQLVNYLGHPHPMICGVAYKELCSLTEALDCTPADLLKPFWRSIGFKVLEDLLSRPQKAQQLSDFLEISVSQLLLQTQVETLPYLVLMKKKDVLKRIATARGTNTTVKDLCMQPRRNLGAILAMLFLHTATDVEKAGMDVLCEVAPEFGDFDFSTLVKQEPVIIAADILRAAAEAEEGPKKQQFRQAFQTFTMITERKPGHTRSSTKSNRMLASFFDNHILGLMAFFSDVIDNTKEPQPMSERNKCLGAIEEMIMLAEAHVSFGLPQIRACLQSAFEVPELRNKAFSAWSSLLTAVDEEDIEPLIDQTFSIVAQNWQSFEPDVQVKAHDVIAGLVQKHNALLRNRIDMLPSLGSMPIMSKIEAEISRFKQKSTVNQYAAFSKRCQDENASVVTQALKDLIPFLEANQQFIHETIVSQHPSPVVTELCRSVLDASIRFTETHSEITSLSAQCLGLIGCLDPSRAETLRPRRDILVLSNFDRASEVLEFTAFMLETVLVKAFQSASSAKAQSFLAYAMQELLKFCGFNTEATTYRPRSSQGSPAYQRWMEIPETVRSTLTPFLTSKYHYRRNEALMTGPQEYPIFSPEKSHGQWLRTFVHDLLQRGKGDNAQMVFPVLARVIRGHDISIATFMFPFAVVNIILGGTEQEVEDVRKELLAVLECESYGSGPESDNVKQCSENVFQVLDYMSRWLQEKRRQLGEARTLAARHGREPNELDEVTWVAQISRIESVLHSIPAEVISQRAVECGSYARALFHWEQYLRQRQTTAELSNQDAEQESLYQHLQYIYTQIDEPDSIEGISAHLQILDPDQQVLEHRKAGRWTAAQSWYELSLADKPGDVAVQYELANCLRESGQYDSLLAHVESFHKNSGPCIPKILSLAAEASWVTGKWQIFKELLMEAPTDLQDFNIGVGRAFLSLRKNDLDGFSTTISELRESVARGLSPSTTVSLQACHDHMLKLHVLYELEAIIGTGQPTQLNRSGLLRTLDQRLDVLGAYTADKQYLLGIRRAAMQLSQRGFLKLDLASAWLTTSRLARKANLTSTAFDAVLHATRLGEDEAKIEHSRLLWKDGHHRKAIQNLEGAIAANAFRSHDLPVASGPDSMAIVSEDQQQLQNKLTARAYLLKAKWLDQAGQTSSSEIISHYHTAIKHFPRQEKGHYLLGKHYNKHLESEQLLPKGKRSLAANVGEYAKLVIENYLRAVSLGPKHLYETVPKILTLWLDLGMEVHKEPAPKVSEREEQKLEAQRHLPTLRHKMLLLINNQVKRYVLDKLPAYIFYTALPQMITRISHPNRQVYELLRSIIVKVAGAHPQQALWALLAVVKSTSPDRSSRGLEILSKLKEYGKKNNANSALELKTLINQGQRISDALLHACDAQVDSRANRVSLSRDLGFSHKLAPCPLVVPIETTLLASLPTGQDQSVRYHKAFSGNVITISSFADDVLVLSSLQRPRKLTVRGSDGRNYGLLCKPKDDLRKDQRLMEFNTMINRALLRDVESSKRRLNIKTYAVTPLNEECGAIEWVEGLKPMRDIVLKLYREKNVAIDYNHTRVLLNEACADPKNVSIFTDRIVKHFQPVLYEWFIETFPEPEAWFNARLKYTRTCAVMSIVGHVLGLGDRHGENVLLVEDDGGVFHVDFNCLFDKGLTFEKPELVPFRLTHNMVDAMGAYGVEGPFRLAAELTLTQLRQNIDTLMTILETFLYDPTADFIGKKKRVVPGVPTTPEEVLDSVRNKVKGLLPGETVPLSVEGYADALISQARDPKNLAAMYIGWCAFF